MSRIVGDKYPGAVGAAKFAVAGAKAATSNFLRAFEARDPHHPYKLLIMGETGSGKTSFLNLLYNCSKVQELGCGFGEEGLKHFQSFNDSSLENVGSNKMESKTSGATLYDVELGALRVGIIDTPGFGDSRGLDQDKKNAKKIIKVLKKEDYVNCVCLVINGRLSRITVSLRYVLTEITAILPKQILNSVVVVFSNTSDLLDLNFDPHSLAAYFGRPIDPQHIFCVENPYCKFEKSRAKQLGCSKKLQDSFEETAEILADVCETIKDFPQVHTLRFIELYEKKQEIEKGVLVLLTAYDNQVRVENHSKRPKKNWMPQRAPNPSMRTTPQPSSFPGLMWFQHLDTILCVEPKTATATATLVVICQRPTTRTSSRIVPAWEMMTSA